MLHGEKSTRQARMGSPRGAIQPVHNGRAMNDSKISLQAALQAQGALRKNAGLEPETFTVPDFVGMISDEIEQLRKLGRGDEEIAGIITANSPIQITSRDIGQHYASPEARNFFKPE